MMLGRRLQMQHLVSGNWSLWGIIEAARVPSAASAVVQALLAARRTVNSLRLRLIHFFTNAWDNDQV